MEYTIKSSCLIANVSLLQRARSMHSFYSMIKHYSPSKDYVLAVILGTEGSTYRKTGAMMLIDDSLNYWGLLSGGCLEGDICSHSKDLFSERQDKVVHYDMRGEDDLLWGMGLGLRWCS